MWARMLGKKDKAISVIRPTALSWDRRNNSLLDYPSHLLLPVRTGDPLDDKVEINGPFTLDDLLDDCFETSLICIFIKQIAITFRH